MSQTTPTLLSLKIPYPATTIAPTDIVKEIAVWYKNQLHQYGASRIPIIRMVWRTRDSFS